MSDIKEIKPLSEWLKFELETNLLDPPEIDVRLSPIYSIAAIDHVDVKGEIKSMTKMVVETVLESVQEWNLTQNGKPIPIDDDMKRKCLLPLLGAKIKGKPQLLGLALWAYATNIENFLKN